MDLKGAARAARRAKGCDNMSGGGGGRAGRAGRGGGGGGGGGGEPAEARDGVGTKRVYREIRVLLAGTEPRRMRDRGLSNGV